MPVLSRLLMVVTHDRRFIEPRDHVLEIEDGVINK
jgi:ABC-type lipoprotein export system ATPase subunit